MPNKNWITQLFSAIDNKNIHQFSSFLSEDCLFRFGNLPAVTGKDSVTDFVDGFLDTIESLRHEVADSWFMQETCVCHGAVTYIRHDKSILTVPFSNIFKLENVKINEYLIFADTSQLYLQNPSSQEHL